MEDPSARRVSRPQVLRLRRVVLRALLACALLLGVGAETRARGGRCPNLVIVLDASESMGWAPDGTDPAPPGGSRWEISIKALKEVLDNYGGQMPIGLSVFASDGVCEGGKLVIAPAYDTRDKIKQVIDATKPESSTPTSPTIENLRREAALRDPSRQQYLLLLTDGEPNCTMDEPSLTYEALRAARLQSPSIKTFVLGLGTLPAASTLIMDKMAEAGGTAVTGGAHAYYTAEDLPSLKAALAKILAVVTGEFSSACDDSCYAADIGCKAPGETCIRGSCRPNPCAGITCDAGQYCYTDGVSPARCVAACATACPRYTRCELGRCVESACPTACGAGLVCDNDTGRCAPDPLCPSNPSPLQKCHAPSLCQRGECVDDPCRFISCPAGTRCLPFSGSCEWAPPSASMDMGASGKTEGEVWHNGGCAVPPQGPGGVRGPGDLSRPGLPSQTGQTGQAGLVGLVGLLVSLGLLLLRRPRRSQRR